MLIKVHACGVNPVETYIRSGTYARKPPLPYTPGSDVAGVIESVGEHVTAFKVFTRWVEFTIVSWFSLPGCCATLPGFVAYDHGIPSRGKALHGLVKAHRGIPLASQSCWWDCEECCAPLKLRGLRRGTAVCLLKVVISGVQKLGFGAIFLALQKKLRLDTFFWG